MDSLNRMFRGQGMGGVGSAPPGAVSIDLLFLHGKGIRKCARNAEGYHHFGYGIADADVLRIRT